MFIQYFFNYNWWHKNKTFKRLLLFVLFVFISIYLISSMYPTFKVDDDVTMGMMSHSYSDIIKIDSLDVHPPLYYLTLKLFLQLTTFWTQSMFIKVLFSRLFSLIFSALSIYILFCILIKECKVYIPIKWQIVFYLLAPEVMSETVKIRMYAFTTFLLIMEFYELIKFNDHHHNFNLILSIIFASLTSYCFYPAAISAGLFLFIYWIYSILNNNDSRENSLLICISGIIFGVLYLPWVNIAFNQFKYHSNRDVIGNSSNYFNSALESFVQMKSPSVLPKLHIELIVLFISLILFIVFLCAIYNLYKYDKNLYKLKKIFFVALINFIITMAILIIICRRHYEPQSLYPIFSICLFIILYELIHIFTSMNTNMKYILLFISVFIFIIYSFGGLYTNIKGYDIPSIQLVKNFKKWKYSSNKDINLYKQTPLQYMQDSVYLKSINKNAVLHSTSKSQMAIQSFNIKDYKPTHDLFNNIKKIK